MLAHARHLLLNVLEIPLLCGHANSEHQGNEGIVFVKEGCKDLSRCQHCKIVPLNWFLLICTQVYYENHHSVASQNRAKIITLNRNLLK